MPLYLYRHVYALCIQSQWQNKVRYRSKVMSHSLAFFSRVNWSTRGKQRVEEMVNQANTRLEPLAKSSFLHTVVSS